MEYLSSPLGAYASSYFLTSSKPYSRNLMMSPIGTCRVCKWCAGSPVLTGTSLVSLRMSAVPKLVHKSCSFGVPIFAVHSDSVAAVSSHSAAL